MSDTIALDLFIQDFVNTNKLLNQHFPWAGIVGRRWVDDAVPRTYEFQSGGEVCYARGQRIDLPDGEWYRIELTRPIPVVDEFRFDYLRMASATTHSRLIAEKIEGAVVVRLYTGNRGLMNIVFVIRDATLSKSPYLL